MDIRKIKKLIELVEESGITELEVQEEEGTVRISRAAPAVAPAAIQYAAAPVVPAAAPAAAPVAGAAPAAPPVAARHSRDFTRQHRLRSPVQRPLRRQSRFCPKHAVSRAKQDAQHHACRRKPPRSRQQNQCRRQPHAPIWYRRQSERSNDADYPKRQSIIFQQNGFPFYY